MARLGGVVASELRTKYMPKSRLGQGLLSMAPWLGIVLLLFGFVLLQGRLVVEAGVAVALPPFVGTAVPVADMTVVVRAITDADGGQAEVIYFGDQRYSLADPTKTATLARELKMRAGRKANPTLSIHADRDIRHGTLVALYAMARDARVVRVTLLTRVDREAPNKK